MSQLQSIMRLKLSLLTSFLTLGLVHVVTLGAQASISNFAEMAEKADGVCPELAGNYMCRNINLDGTPAYENPVVINEGMVKVKNDDGENSFNAYQVLGIYGEFNFVVENKINTVIEALGEPRKGLYPVKKESHGHFCDSGILYEVKSTLYELAVEHSSDGLFLSENQARTVILWDGTPGESGARLNTYDSFYSETIEPTAKFLRVSHNNSDDHLAGAFRKTMSCELVDE